MPAELGSLLGLRILGQDSGRERDAANELATELSKGLRPDDDLVIVVGAKCYGQLRQDIDLLVFGDFRPSLEFAGKTKSKAVLLDSFVLAIEVKDHRPGDIRFTDNQVEVRYDGNWSNVSHAVFQQRFAVKDFLTANNRRAPYVLSAIWLRNVARSELPEAPNNILVGRPTAYDVWALIVSLSNAHGFASNPLDPVVISCGPRPAFLSAMAAAELFVREIRPTELDRRKLERICEKQTKGAQYLDLLGRQMLIFKGRGGAGKTIRLLQLAKTLHDDSGSRILFLTYNKALAADVRRLLAILGVRDKVDGPTIHVSSSDAFFWALLGSFGLEPTQPPGGEFPAKEYVDRKKELLQLLRSASPQEIRSDPTACRHPDVFYWDCVCIDEAQDWPEDERDLLIALFGVQSLVIADGVDQLVRQSRRCDWAAAAPRSRQIVTLRKSMRLKSNLCRFVSSLSEELGTPWEMEVNPDIRGGQVIIIEGSYTEAAHRTALEEHLRLGNLPIDFMFCVTGAEGSESAGLASKLVSWGFQVWDGTSKTERSTFPTDTAQFRIVKYESARGLEGWTVACLDFDLFFEKQVRIGQTVEKDLLESQAEVAHAFAAQWALIPVTRAVDTLILQVQRKGAFRDALFAAADAHRDFVKVIS